jgi:DNA-binding beta-propeller fold protein YncE
VKVGLGLGARFDRIIRDDPGLLMGVVPSGLACDAGGNLYVVSDGPVVRVLDRDGNYLRMLLPPPAHVMNSEKSPELVFFKRFDGREVPRFGDTWLYGKGFQPGGMSDRSFDSGIAPTITPDGKELLMQCSAGAAESKRTLFWRIGTDGSLPLGSMFLLQEGWSNTKTSPQTGPMAVSPDGTWVYFGSPRHAVYRRKLAEMKRALDKSWDKGGVVPDVFLGEPNKAGNDDTHFNGIQGLACDADGNLYVSDSDNNRIQVFSAEGKLVRALPVDGPRGLGIHRKTGNLFVYCFYRPPGKGRVSEVVKLDKAGAKLAAVAVAPIWRNDDAWPAMFCFDGSGAEGVFYTFERGEGSNVLVKYADRDGKLEKAKNLTLEARARLPGWPATQAGGMSKTYLDVDRAREELYLGRGQDCFPAHRVRIDGRTGKVLGVIEAPIELAAVGPDGLLYLRVETAGPVLVRVNPEDGKPVPFATGVEYTYRGQKTTAVKYLSEGGTRSFQDGLTVAPNGDIYAVLDELGKAGAEAVSKLGDPVPGDIRRNLTLLQVNAPDGTLKTLNAIPGLLHNTGVKVARNGNIVIGTLFQPQGQKLPEGSPDGLTNDRWGTVLCLDSSFNKFPAARFRGGYAGQLANGEEDFVQTFSQDWRCRIETVRWKYTGFGPTSGLCYCLFPKFDLDGFDRAWIPNGNAFSVDVLDINGNLITHLGSYGNADSRGKDSPVIDPKTGLLRPRRADDPASLQPPKELAEGIGFRIGRFVACSDEALYIYDSALQRILRCALTAAAEETVPVP